MSAVGKPGRPKRSEAGASMQLSMEMLRRHVEGATVHQLAAEHGLSPTVTWNRIQRARAAAREAEQR